MCIILVDIHGLTNISKKLWEVETHWHITMICKYNHTSKYLYFEWDSKFVSGTSFLCCLQGSEEATVGAL